MEYLPDYTQETILGGSASPQAKAYEWLIEDHKIHRSYSVEKLLQRFALVTLYYSTNGENWIGQGENVYSEFDTYHPDCKGPTGGPPWPGDLKFYDGKWLDHEIDECHWFANNRFVCNAPPACDEGAYISSFLTENNLVGRLPPEFSLLSSIRSINLKGNQLSGILPQQIFQNLSPTQVDFSDNQLSGSVPTEIGLWNGSLQALVLNHNRLSGSIPSVGEFPDLRVLSLADNKFDGTIPSELGLCPSLSEMILKNNQLSGTIASQLGGLSGLEALSVAGNNALSGSIPEDLGILTNRDGTTGSMLKVLYLDGTRLSGTLATEWCQVERLKFDCSTILCGCDCQCA